MWLVGLLLVGGVLGVLIWAWIQAIAADGNPGRELVRRDAGLRCYRRPLMTANELRFYLALAADFADFGVVVFVKVRLADLCGVKPGSGRGWWNKISQKHVDFVVYAVEKMRVECCIELEDSTHATPSAAARDADKDRVLEAAGMTLLRVRGKANYAPGDVKELLRVAAEKGDRGQP